MRNLMALLYYLCALFGCDVGGTVTVHRASADGSILIDSQARVSERIARFECRQSRSGQCHYTLLRTACAPSAQPAATAPECSERAFERFVLDAGQTREIIDIAPGFTICAEPSGAPVGAGCRVEKAMEKRAETHQE